MLPGDGELALRIRPYLATGGRTAVDPRLRVDSTVRTTGRIAPEAIRVDHAEALLLCEQPASVAEIAARLGQPVLITKVLISDLLAASALTVRVAPADTRVDAPDPQWRWSWVDSASFEAIPVPVKLVAAGGFGVGKTTFIGSCSEVSPLCTEEILTTASVGIDDFTGIRNKTTTTVAADFGRLTFRYSHHNVVLYLFGTPG